MASPTKAARIAWAVLAGPADRRGGAEVRTDPCLQQFRLIRRCQHQFGPRLRLEARAHQLAPDFRNQLRLRTPRARLQPFENLCLPLGPHLQVTVALGILLRGDIRRRGQPTLDQVENLVVDPVELGAQRGEALQLFLGHFSSRACRMHCRGGLRVSLSANFRPPVGVPARKRDKDEPTQQVRRADRSGADARGHGAQRLTKPRRHVNMGSNSSHCEHSRR